MRLYAIAIMFETEQRIECMSGALLAGDPIEARLKAFEYALNEYPPEKGYSGHRVSLTEIQATILGAGEQEE